MRKTASGKHARTLPSGKVLPLHSFSAPPTAPDSLRVGKPFARHRETALAGDAIASMVVLVDRHATWKGSIDGALVGDKHTPCITIGSLLGSAARRF